MNQVGYFMSGPNRLSYVYTLPEKQRIKAGLIFVHAADGNRLGPHRMFVEVADNLKADGIASLRFDMRGCGDSEGEPAGKDINSDIEDLRNAVAFFLSRHRPPKIFFFGISRGSFVSLSVLADHSLPIDGAILLSMPFSGTKAAAKKISGCLKEYLYKFWSLEYLKKLLSGKANLRQILRTLAFALNSQKTYHENRKGFSTRCPLLFIYPSKDPVTADSVVYYRRVCEIYTIPYQIVEIANSNHSFFHYQWKEQIVNLSRQWLLEKLSMEE